jgi:hypothetical protein
MISTYKLEEDLIELSKNYFFNENGEALTDDELVTLKTGYFGWMLEALSQMQMNDLYTISALYDEHFKNTAVFPKSIYNFCTLENFDSGIAKPGVISTVNIHIKLSDLKNLRNLNQQFIYISKNTTFSNDTYSYILPATIKINNFSESYLSAEYLMTDLNFSSNSVFEIKSQILKTAVDTSSGTFIINVSLIQAKKNSLEFIYNNTNLSKIEKFSISFENQLADFRVIYKGKSLDNELELNKIFSNTPSSLEDKDNAINYYYEDDNTLVIYVSPYSNFIPENGSIIRVEYFETMGAYGNTGQYKNLLKYAFNNQVYKDIQLYVLPQSACVGGINKLTISELKAKLLKLNSSNVTLITDKDIENYFNYLSSTYISENNKLSITKYRSDIERIFNANLLFKIGSKTIPTNTLDINIPMSLYDLTSDILIPAGSTIYSLREETQSDSPGDPPIITYTTPVLSLSEPDLEAYDLVYRTIYDIYIKQTPFSQVLFYRTSINEKFEMKIASMIENKSYIIVNNISVFRDSLNSNSITASKYNIKFNITTNTPNSIVPNIYFYKIIEGTKVYINQYPFKIYSLEATDSGYIASFDLICSFTNGVYTVSQTGNSMVIEEDIYMDIIIFEKNDAIAQYEFDKYDNKLLDRDETVNIAYISNAGLSEYYGTALKLSTSLPIKFINNINNILSSYVTANPENSCMVLSSIPVLGSNIIGTDEYVSFIQQLSDYEKTLSEGLSKLEQNTNLNIQFYNTYGTSRIYNCYTTYLESMEADIITNITPTYESSVNIKNFISDYIFNINDDVNHMLIFSKLAAAIENKFPEVYSIIFKSINGISTSSLDYISSNTNGKEQLNKEFLNISPENIKLTYKNI